MKDVNKFKKNVKVMLLLFTAMFAALIIYLGYSVITFGDKWYSTPYNPRIQNALQENDAGKILDRTGAVLAYTEDDTRYYTEDKSTRLAVSHVVGDTYGMTVGAESVFAKYLYGMNKGAADRFNSVLSGATEKGSDITLTIDAGLSKYIYREMDDMQGCVVVMNYKTGEILANVSLPAFDPNTVKDEALQDTSLVDRAVMGRYPPGSLMKIVTAVQAVESGIYLEYTCSGEDYIGGQRVTCVSEHGSLDLKKAFAKSCNCYFAHLSDEIGAAGLLKNAGQFGFNREFNFSDIVLYRSNFEVSAEQGDAAWAGIGQYKDLITPMHAVMITGAIANDGVMMTPKLLKSASSGTYSTYTMSSKAYATVTDSQTAAVIGEYMRSVVAEGTGTSAAVSGLDICGKTGTAEFYDEETGGNKNHSWFSGFIDDEEKPYAVAVIFEGAGYGSKYAAPMAGRVFKYLADNL